MSISETSREVILLMSFIFVVVIGIISAISYDNYLDYKLDSEAVKLGYVQCKYPNGYVLWQKECRSNDSTD